MEIPIQGFGWVTIDPSPGKIAAATPPSASGTAGGGGTPTATQTPTGLVTSSAGGRAVAPPTTLRRTQSVPTASVVAAVVGSAVALVLLALAILLLRKALRVRRRRGWGDPRLRLLGAWQESLDVLAESGAPDLSALTSSEVDDVTDAQFGPDAGQHARRIGERANTAIFSPTSWIGADEADAAWQNHASLRRAIGARLTVRQRMGAGLR